MVEAEDGRLYGHAKDCADRLEAAGVARAHTLLRNWIRRGKLRQVTEFDDRPVYSMSEVFAVERATRRAGKRGRALTTV